MELCLGVQAPSEGACTLIVLFAFNVFDKLKCKVCTADLIPLQFSAFSIHFQVTLDIKIEIAILIR